MEANCKFCGNPLTPTQIKESVKPEVKQFWDEGIKREAKMIPYNDAFYEIVTGRFKGNLVHIFNIIKR